jgi:hypothetical protein
MNYVASPRVCQAFLPFVLCILAGCTSAPSAADLARQRQHEEEMMATPFPAEEIALRQQLAEEYRQLFVGRLSQLKRDSNSRGGQRLFCLSPVVYGL